MSKYRYFSVHDLLDLAMIYRDCGDYMPRFWSPELQKELFCVGMAVDSKHRNVSITLGTNKKPAFLAEAFFGTIEEFYDYDNDADAFHVIALLQENEDRIRSFRVSFTGSSNPDKEIYFNISK